ASYLGESVTDETFERDGLAMRFVSRHRPLQTYTELLAANGLLIERLREPELPEAGFNSEHAPRWRRIPLFLHVRALKTGLDPGDRLDLDEGTGRKLRHLYRGARRRLLA